MKRTAVALQEVCAGVLTRGWEEGLKPLLALWTLCISARVLFPWTLDVCFGQTDDGTTVSGENRLPESPAAARHC